MAHLRNTPRLLRVGVIKKGRIVEERLVRRLGDITLGTSPRCTFVTDHGPERVVVLRRDRRRASLVFRDGDRGKLASSDAVLDLRTLRARGIARRRKDTFEVPLPEDARGKLVVGEVTLLFQLVDGPPPQALQLPASMRRRMRDRVDMRFAPFFAASLALQVGAVMFMATLEPMAELRTVPDAWVDRFIEAEARRIEQVPETPEEMGPVVADGIDPAGPKEPKPPVDDAKRPPKGDKEKKDTPVKPDETVISIIGSKGKNGLTMVEEMVATAQDVTVAEAFRGATMRVASNDKKRDRRLVRPGPGVVSIHPELKARGGVAVSVGPKREARVRGSVQALVPKKPIGLGDADPVAIADAVRRRLKDIQGCYERELRNDQTLAGKVVVQMTISEMGRASGVKTVHDGVGGGKVARCVGERLKRIRFPKPSGGTVTVRYPFVFTRKG